MTFLFDIGKVLLDFDFENSLRHLLPPETPAQEIDERLARMLERKDDFESGRVSPEDYIPWALEILGHEITHEKFVTAWQNIFTPNQAMWRVVEKLHGEGHRLILFSNTNAIHCPWVFDEFSEFSMFDGGVLSFETGYIKPQPEIYQHAVDTHALIPESTLYIDDLPQNIETGRQFGFHCWQYDLNEHAAFEEWLATFSL